MVNPQVGCGIEVISSGSKAEYYNSLQISYLSTITNHILVAPGEVDIN